MGMKMVRAVIRPEVEREVVLVLEAAGYPALTKSHVFGRGKQGGLRVGPVRYEELPKVSLMLVVDEERVPEVVKTIEEAARTGNIGDGKIFVSPVEQAWTIRTGRPEL